MIGDDIKTGFIHAKDWKSLQASSDTAVVAGEIAQMGDTYGIAYESVDGTIKKDYELIWQCDKVDVPKTTAATFTVGKNMYMDPTLAIAGVHGTAAEGDICVGIAYRKALADDLTVFGHFDGGMK